MLKYNYRDSIGFVIHRMGKFLVYLMDQELRKKFDVTFGQWKVMIILSNNDGGLTQKEIAEKLALEGPTLIPIIDKLEKDRFVIRKVDPKDRRINRIFLIEKANNILPEMIECISKIKEIALNGISEDNISITKNTLEYMRLNLQKEFNLNCLEDDQKKNFLIQSNNTKSLNSDRIVQTNL